MSEQNVVFIRPVCVSKDEAARILGKRRAYIDELVRKHILELHVLPASDSTKTNRPVIRYSDLEALPIPLRLAPRRKS